MIKNKIICGDSIEEMILPHAKDSGILPNFT